MHTSTAARTGALILLIAAQGCAPVGGDDEVDSTAQAITSTAACTSIATPPTLVCQGAASGSWYTFPSVEVNRACNKDTDCVVQRFTVNVCGDQRATAITNTPSNRTNFQRLALTGCAGFDAARCGIRWTPNTTTTTDSGRVVSNKVGSTDSAPVALCCNHVCAAW